MRVYKLTSKSHVVKEIEKTNFEYDTDKKYPHYQQAADGLWRQYAVCPACDNPIQIIGLYKPLSNTDRPYGKHTGKRIDGFPDFGPEAHQWCPYVSARSSGGKTKRKSIDGLPLKILRILADNFDRVLYILEKDTGVRISDNLAKSMLETYMGEEGYLYTGANLRNVPWIFAYMADAQSLFGQKIVSNDELKGAITSKIENARIDESGRITRGQGYYSIDLAFIDHAYHLEDHEIVESVVMHVVDGNGGVVYETVLDIDPARFASLINTPPQFARRNMSQVAMAQAVIDPFLEAHRSTPEVGTT
ncbi:hypothetical protein HEQ72_05010 [Haematospirillum sp. 15-248]|uniref:hypothetical protein n=1 Tax=Haematospirillum sp. 15-248 TaxID=2723107 RepID=UPI00143B7116|nr:hypothetical protein [Haematospirillum sp. 15-248]NKD87666.1 hypothetical protein [Haematospirillum sp. 15-248]